METPANVTTSPPVPAPVPVAEDEAPARPALRLVSRAADQMEASRLHPSALGHTSATSAVARSTEDIDLRRRFPPITCTACGVTYLTPPERREPTSAADWVCPLCQGQGLDEPVGDVTLAEQPE